jgi:hypothetical protein
MYGTRDMMNGWMDAGYDSYRRRKKKKETRNIHENSSLYQYTYMYV